MAEDPRFRTNSDRLVNRPALKDSLEQIFSAMTVEALVSLLETHSVPCGRVRSIREVLQDPQIVARDMLVTQPHRGLGAVATVGNPVKLSRTPAVIQLPPPDLGEHTTEVLQQLSLDLDPSFVPSPS
jgi:crotonobetainyl-CoA:carnitine CoA-transferase CaiB-like acyl-CoA transferase